MAPTFDPALNIPVARARSCLGNHSATVLIDAGKLPASPSPNAARAIPNPRAERAPVCSLKRGDDVSVFDFAPADRPLKIGRQNAEDLPVDVINARREKEERAYIPAQSAGRRLLSFGGVVDLRQDSRHGELSQS